MSEETKRITFTPDETSTLPIWVQLRKRIAFLITSGYFVAGDQLPKIRELAADISINFNTVNKAYLSLQSDGYLVSVRGKGVFVSDAARVEEDDSKSEIDALLDDCLHACKNLGLSYDEAVAQMNVRVMRLKMAEAVPHCVAGTKVISLYDEETSKDGHYA